MQTKPIWRLALVLVGLHVVSMLFFGALVDAGQRGGEQFFDNLWLSGTILFAGLFALTAGVMSVIAVAFRRERSIISWAIILFGLFVLTFALGEVLVPH